jgi:hypothetical protein
MSTMYCRSNDTGMTIPITHDIESMFVNAYPCETHKRMITFNLGISGEPYMTLNNVNVIRSNGNELITKVTVNGIPSGTWDTLRMFRECVVRMYPGMIVDPLSRETGELKLVLKKKWYRAYDKNGEEIVPSHDVIKKMVNYGRASFQIHARVLRTHENRILFQPMIRKVYLH